MKEGQQHRHNFCLRFPGCCNAYSNDFKSIYTGPSFAYMPLDHNQSRLSLPTRFLHQLHAALPASASVLSVLGKLASIFPDVIIILTMGEGGGVWIIRGNKKKYKFKSET